MGIAASLLLLMVANGAPILAAYVLGERGAWRVDAGQRFVDGELLFGESKTWRGIGAAIFSSALLAPALGYPAMLGVLFALCSMLGDLFSSFIKRRLHIPASGRMTGVDQLPEALLPLLLLREQLALDIMGIAVVLLAFVVLEKGVSRWLYRWHIRKRPY